jgi:hypothetical protein
VIHLSMFKKKGHTFGLKNLGKIFLVKISPFGY